MVKRTGEPILKNEKLQMDLFDWWVFATGPLRFAFFENRRANFMSMLSMLGEQPDLHLYRVIPEIKPTYQVQGAGTRYSRLR
jgi:hypothetical protein